MFNWIRDYQLLSPPALTVRAQAVPVFDTGRLTFTDFYTRQDAGSIKLRDILKPIWRPVADRRPWSGNGRQVTPKTATIRDFEMVPISAWHTIGEYEYQRMMESNGNNADMARKALGIDIGSRVELLSWANWYRMELDSTKAWCDGQITIRDPDTGTTQVVSIPVDSGRYTTAGTAWNDSGVNAFTALVNWLKTGQDTIGAIEGVRLRRATFNEIQADAPAAIFRITNQVARINTKELTMAIQDELSSDFRFVIDEGTVDVFSNAGMTTASTKLWTDRKVAAIPAGGIVGASYYAPVMRAQEAATLAPTAGIDVRGVSVFPCIENGGKDLKIDTQLNALSIPDDQLLWVIDAGV